MDLSIINEINEQLKDRSAEEVLSYFINEYKDKIALASSLSAEDQVLTDMIIKKDKNIKVEKPKKEKIKKRDVSREINRELSE